MVGKRIAKALYEAGQAKIEQWFHAIDNAISQKAQDLIAYENKKKQVMPKIIEAHAKGISLRELTRITGIPHQTLAKWLKQHQNQQSKDRAVPNA